MVNIKNSPLEPCQMVAKTNGPSIWLSCLSPTQIWLNNGHTKYPDYYFLVAESTKVELVR